MDRQFEAHLKKKNVDKKTIKALKKESITTTDVLKQCTDADIESMCVEHKLGVAAKVALRQIRDELKLTSGNVSMAEQDRPMFDSYDLDPPPSSSRYKDPYSPTTTPSLPIPPHPSSSSSRADDAMGGSVKSVEFNARGAHYLSTSAGSVSTMQELNKVWQQHDELDRLKQKGLMTSKEADLDKQRLVAAKSPVFDRLEASMGRRSRSLDRVDDRINRLTDETTSLIRSGTRDSHRKKWWEYICPCISR